MVAADGDKKYTFRKICENSNVHGVSNIAKSRYCLSRCFWIVVTLISLGFLVYLMRRAVMGFVQHPSATSYSIEKRPNMTLPAVIVCPNKAFPRLALERLNISDGLMNYILKLHTGFHSGSFDGRMFLKSVTYNMFRPYYDPKDHEKYGNEYEALVRQQLAGDIRNLYLQHGLQCQDMFINCEWNVFPFDCCIRARPFIDPFKGKCFKFELEHPQGYSGASFGFKMIMGVERDQLWYGTESIAPEDFSVGITNRGSPFFIADYATVPFGKTTNIQVELEDLEFINVLQRAKSCEDDSQGDTLTDVTCRERDKLRMQSQQCGCTFLLDAGLVDRYKLTDRVCSPLEASRCLEPKSEEWKRNETLGTVNNCLQSCHQVQYKTMPSYLPIDVDLKRAVFGSWKLWDFLMNHQLPAAEDVKAGTYSEGDMRAYSAGNKGTYGQTGLQSEKSQPGTVGQNTAIDWNQKAIEKEGKPVGSAKQKQVKREIKTRYQEIVEERIEALEDLDGFDNFHPITDGMKRNFLVINVYYARFQITKITEVNTMTLESIVGNVGGTMGVFLGCSIITLIETVYQLLALCCSRSTTKEDPSTAPYHDNNGGKNGRDRRKNWDDLMMMKNQETKTTNWKAHPKLGTLETDAVHGEYGNRRRKQYY